MVFGWKGWPLTPALAKHLVEPVWIILLVCRVVGLSRNLLKLLVVLSDNLILALISAISTVPLVVNRLQEGLQLTLILQVIHMIPPCLPSQNHSQSMVNFLYFEPGPQQRRLQLKPQNSTFHLMVLVVKIVKFVCLHALFELFEVVFPRLFRFLNLFAAHLQEAGDDGGKLRERASVLLV